MMRSFQIWQSEFKRAAKCNDSSCGLATTVAKQHCSSKIIAVTLGPCVLALFLWILATFLWHNKVPQSFNRDEWLNFTKSVQEAVNVTNSNQLIGILFMVHFLQVIFCIPLMHVTKILYGFFFGTAVGGLMACVWEMGLILVAVVVCVYRQHTATVSTNYAHLVDYTENLRRRGQLYMFLIVLQMASIPLFSSLTLVSYQVVTATEFSASHFIVTAVMTFKDTFLGDFIAQSDGRTGHVFIGISVFVLSTLLPSLITVIVSCVCSHHVMQLVKKIQTEETDDTDAGRSDSARKQLFLNDEDASEYEVCMNDSGYNSDDGSEHKTTENINGVPSRQ